VVLGLSAGDQQAALRCVAVPVVCRSSWSRECVRRPADNTADLATLVPGCFLSANVQFSTNFYNHGDPTFDVRSEEMKKVTVCTHTSLRFGPRQERPLPCRHGRMLRRAGAPVPKTDRFARALTCASCLPRAVPAHGRALVDARLPRPQRSDSPAFLRL